MSGVILTDITDIIIMKTFRIKFEKTGLAKYISHLDLNRLFSRSIARAGIEIAHTEGFNPRPKIVFASAISLGMESLCEFTDIKITENLTEAEVFQKIKDIFPNGINILEVYEPKNDFKYIDRTRFHIFVKPDGFGADELKKLFEGDVFAEKKPGININLKDYILELNISISGESQEYKLINAVVKTNPEMYLNPENIIKAVNSKYIVDDYYIQKIEAYDKNNAIFR